MLREKTTAHVNKVISVYDLNKGNRVDLTEKDVLVLEKRISKTKGRMFVAKDNLTSLNDTIVFEEQINNTNHIHIDFEDVTRDIIIPLLLSQGIIKELLFH
jgi:hypothetical protein